MSAMQRLVHQFDNGVRVYDDHLTQIQRDRYMKRNVHESVEEDVFLEIIRAIPPDGCFVNVGAAIGYYALLAKRVAPGLVIHAVEPLARHRRFFRENVALNGLGSGDFTLHHEGVFSANGHARLVDENYGSSLLRDLSFGARLRALFTRGDHANISRVKTMTLDRLLDRVGRPVDLLLMDIQGLEASVLASGSRSLQSEKIATALIGTHGPDIHRECARILEQHQYAIEYDDPHPNDQPDGLVVASRRTRRLKRK